MSAAIDVSQLGKTIQVGFWGKDLDLLKDVTFSVAQGVTVGFVGANGAGKSTTIKHIIGGARPTHGTVRVLGGDPFDPAVRRRFGYMPELPYLPPTLTPLEMMNLHATLCGMRSPGPRIHKLLEATGLGDRTQQRVGSFSKGQQTRLSLALALVHEPEILVLDEPMSGLDPSGRLQVRHILRDEAAAGRTVFFSSHVLSDVEALCDSVVVIEKGRLVYSGSATDVMGSSPELWEVRVQTPGLTPPGGVSEWRKEGDTLVVTVIARDGVEAVLRMKDAGATVLGLEPKRATFEDRLLQLIGRSNA